MSLKIVSWNVGGITSPIKRKAILRYAKKLGTQILLLQETHLKGEEAAKLKGGWVNEVIFTLGQQRKKGVAILFNKLLDYKVNNLVRDEEGRYIIMEVVMGEKKIVICNVYGPNEEDTGFWQTLRDKLLKYSGNTLIIGGDFNIAPNSTLDRCRDSTVQAVGGKILDKTTIARRKRESNTIKRFQLDLKIVDSYRIMHPDDTEFTCFSKSKKTLSRIDYFLVSEKLMDAVQETHIDMITISDHAPIVITLNPKCKDRKTNQFFFPKYLIKNTKFINFLKEKWAEYKRFNEGSFDKTHIFWNAAKAVLRGEITTYLIRLKKNELI